MGVPWVEKYRPRGLSEIIGNNQIIGEIKKWAENWEKGRGKKALILVGKPGCGKTSVARALANDMGWGIIELNASDVRNERRIKEIAMTGAINETFTDDGRFISTKEGGRKLIIFDEADNLYEAKDDRGGKKAIVETIKVSKQPIILIGNDYYSILGGVWGRKLRGMCQILKFRALTPSQIIKVLDRICKIEGIKYDKKVLRSVAVKSGGDLRAAINDLQAIAQGKNIIKIDDVDALGWRDVKNEIYKSTLITLHTTSFLKAKEQLKNLDEPPDYILLWIEENMPLEYTKSDDLIKGYEYLSRADVYLGRVMRRQQYSLWSYSMDMISAVSIAKKEKYEKHPRYNFPSWLRVMSKSKSRRNLRDGIGMKIGRIYHSSHRRVKDSIFPYFQVLYDNDEELRALYTYILHFDENEIGYLTNKNPEEILQEAEKIKEKIEKRGEGGSS